jgi:hypothetical protein
MLNEVETAVADADRKASFYQRLGWFLDWVTPLGALAGTILALRGEQWRVHAAIIGAFVTFFTAVNAKVHPREEAIAAMARRNAFAKFRIELKGTLEAKYRDNSGSDPERYDKGELEYVNSLGEKLAELREFTGKTR